MSQNQETDSKGQSLFPEVTFSTFIMSLASSTLMHLGEVPNPENGQLEPNPELARHTIDLLNMLEDKLENGLDDKERRLFQDILYELRMKFVAKS